MAATTLHRVSWSCPDEGRRQEWFTTWNKAMAFARRERIADNAHFDQVEIPKTRLALCEWLNKNTMIHDLVRTACVIAVMAVASALLIETRLHLAAIDAAQRQAMMPMAGLPSVPPQPAPASPPGRLRAVGRAVIDLAEAGLGVVR